MLASSLRPENVDVGRIGNLAEITGVAACTLLSECCGRMFAAAEHLHYGAHALPCNSEARLFACVSCTR